MRANERSHVCENRFRSSQRVKSKAAEHISICVESGDSNAIAIAHKLTYIIVQSTKLFYIIAKPSRIAGANIRTNIHARMPHKNDCLPIYHSRQLRTAQPKFIRINGRNRPKSMLIGFQYERRANKKKPTNQPTTEHRMEHKRKFRDGSL